MQTAIPAAAAADTPSTPRAGAGSRPPRGTTEGLLMLWRTEGARILIAGAAAPILVGVFLHLSRCNLSELAIPGPGCHRLGLLWHIWPYYVCFRTRPPESCFLTLGVLFRCPRWRCLCTTTNSRKFSHHLVENDLTDIWSRSRLSNVERKSRIRHPKRGSEALA